MGEKKTKSIILDSTAFIRLDFPSLLEDDQIYFTCDGVINEIRDFKSRMNVEVLLSTKRLMIIEPSVKCQENVIKKVKSLNYRNKLSDVDISVIALAAEKNAKILTNDIAIQIVSRAFRIETIVISGKKVDKSYKRSLRCKQCKRFIKSSEDLICDVCGGKLI